LNWHAPNLPAAQLKGTLPPENEEEDDLEEAELSFKHQLAVNQEERLAKESHTAEGE
jgi:hypothetical protein